ncbi:uncharacterized protein BT62DRAFT_937269 [Guyanagaster necrorhizus]|uniref:Extracellular membrane protein CFEM domain-containing protein n=1 Tax=Guyanagaster necrorhizus TaxID=856835 RepID=A0A9P7VIG1_9AGAR|nr:uncharacterized protein BT62DRAFT_937269 [Guyanagaster necrorhizus MCA 3950]KAG7441212.1 hypothetical protein BT62DRAFT_937269 [Guyanagaster necrorhizus MCA 3950]
MLSTFPLFLLCLSLVNIKGVLGQELISWLPLVHRSTNTSAVNISYIPDACTSNCEILISIVACGSSMSSCLCSTNYNASVSNCLTCFKSSASGSEEDAMLEELDELYAECEAASSTDAATTGGIKESAALAGMMIATSWILTFLL